MLEWSRRTLARPGGQPTVRPFKAVTVGLVPPPCGQSLCFLSKPLAEARFFLTWQCGVDTLTHCVCGPKSLLQRTLEGGDMWGTQLEEAVLLRFFSLPFLLMGRAFLQRKLRHTWSLSLWRGSGLQAPCPFLPQTRKQEGTVPIRTRGRASPVASRRPWDPPH